MRPRLRHLVALAISGIAALAPGSAPLRACADGDGSLASLLRSPPEFGTPEDGDRPTPGAGALRWCEAGAAPFWELVEARECTLPHVATALVDAGEAALDIVTAALEDPKPEARTIAAWALRELTTPPLSDRWTSPADPTLVAALDRALGDEVVDVRRLAASAAWRLGPDAAPLVSALRRLLHDADPATRVEAIQALGDADLGDDDVAAELLDLLSDSDPAVARAAAYAVSAWGPAVAPALQARAEFGHDNVRAAAAVALRALQQAP